MKVKILILIVLITIIYFPLLIADNFKLEVLQTKSAFFSKMSLTCGAMYGFSGARVNLKYYIGSFNFAARYSDYDIFFIGTKPYDEGVTLSHKDFALTLNKVIYSPYSNVHCSLGSGLIYRIRKVRDERISYENWTSKDIIDIGVPIEFNLESFLIPNKVVINFGYNTILIKKDFIQSLFLDFGVWLGQ